MTTWTTPATIRDRARRRWEDSSILRFYVAGAPCPPLDIPVRGPTAREIGPDLARVREWRDALVAGGRAEQAYHLSTREVGGRAIGRMIIPDRVSITAFEQYWRLLGVAQEVRQLDHVVAQTRDSDERLLDWVALRPLAALELADDWTSIVATAHWLAAEAGRGRYLREVDTPGVDTKFIERHQRVLGELLACLDHDWLDNGSSGRTFATRHGFREPERLVQLRFDPALGALPSGIDEAALPLLHAGALTIEPEHVLVVENQVTFLSVPVPARGVVVWGHGFDALRLGSVRWLRGAADVRYWGDIDTHGLAILNGLRTQVPAVRSVLMDVQTLLQHRDRWGVEPRPTRADLRALLPEERRLYLDLIEGTHGPNLRLEQERVDWAYALRVLTGDPRVR